jgi:hypothetical protein
MKKTLHIFIISLIGLTAVHSQSLNKQYVDNWILNVFPQAAIDESTLYIFNGMPYQGDSIEHLLKKYKRDDLIKINVLDKRYIDSSTIFIPRSSIIYMTTKGEMTDKEIKKEFKGVKDRFVKRKLIVDNIDISLGEPVLVINGVQIFHADCYKRINNIDVSKIIGINCIDQPVSETVYGSNGINGLIEIKTK